MERRNEIKWINDLKVAVINRDLKQLESLSKREVINFSDVSLAKEALNYINKATEILKEEKEKINQNMIKIKQEKKFNPYSYYDKSSFSLKG